MNSENRYSHLLRPLEIGRTRLANRVVSFAFLWTFIRGSLLGSLTGFRHPSASDNQPRMDNPLRDHI